MMNLDDYSGQEVFMLLLEFMSINIRLHKLV